MQASTRLKASGWQEAMKNVKERLKTTFAFWAAALDDHDSTPMRGIYDPEEAEKKHRLLGKYSNAFLTQYPPTNEQPPTPWNGFRHNFQRMALLAHCRKAEGAPNSQERQERLSQIHEEMIIGIADYYSWMKKDMLAHFLLEQPEGYWFAACLEAYQASQGSWSLDFLAERESLQSGSAKLMEEYEKWMKSGRVKGVANKIQPIPLGGLDGTQVAINILGKMRFHFLDQSNMQRTIDARVGFGISIAPVGPGDFRTIHFTEQGIEIRGVEGQPFCHPGERATVPVSSLESTGGRCGRDLVYAWESVTGLQAPTSAGAVPTDLSMMPSSGSGVSGQQIPTRTRKADEALCVPAPQDALWLLDRYLEVYYPQGGRFWPMSRQHFPASADDTSRFLE